jgi:hypothetical protein
MAGTPNGSAPASRARSRFVIDASALSIGRLSRKPAEYRAYCARLSAFSDFSSGPDQKEFQLSDTQQRAPAEACLLQLAARSLIDAPAQCRGFVGSTRHLCFSRISTSVNAPNRPCFAKVGLGPGADSAPRE